MKTRVGETGGRNQDAGRSTDKSRRNNRSGKAGEEPALQISANRYRQLLEAITDYVFSVRIENDKPMHIEHGFGCSAITGYTPEEYEADPGLWLRMVYKEDRQAVLRQVASILKEHKAVPLEHRIFHKDGSIRWIKSTPVLRFDANGRLIGYDSLISEITARKQAELELASRDRLLSGVADASNLLLSRGDYRETVGTALQILGETANVDRIYIFENHEHPVTGEMLASQRFEWTREAIHPEIDNPQLQGASYSALGMERWYRVLSAGESLRGSIAGFPESERELLAAQEIQSILIVPILLSGQFWGFVGFDACRQDRQWTDHEESILRTMAASLGETIERDRARAALATEQKRLSDTLAGIQEGVISLDSEGTVTLANKAALALTGSSMDAIVGKHVHEIFHIYELDGVAKRDLPLAEVSRHGKTVRQTKAVILRGANGEEAFIIYALSPIRDQQNKIIGQVLVFEDITERRKIEEEALRASKLESIGVLAGGIAHDFNNILMGITGNISIVKSFCDLDSEAHELLAEAERECRRAEELTGQLLTFARGGAPIKKLSSIGELLRETATFVLRGSNVTCDLTLPEDLWSVEIDVGQISHVVQNLVLNAQQAMPEGGAIEIVAENARLRAGERDPLPAGNYVQIQIRDQGVGIPENHLQRIFDPYFTTKQKGSGLGLATSFSIMKRHGGYIFAQSQIGAGSTFTLVLPAKGKPRKRKSGARAEILKGSGRILIMDDEECVRSIAGRMLVRLGYAVDLAENGEQMLALYKDALARGKRYAAVIMDLTVPGAMGGKEAMQKLRELDPEAVGIVSSGYSKDPVMSEFKRFGFSAVMTKPYDLAQLSRVLHQVVQSKRPAK